MELWLSQLPPGCQSEVTATAADKGWQSVPRYSYCTHWSSRVHTSQTEFPFTTGNPSALARAHKVMTRYRIWLCHGSSPSVMGMDHREKEVIGHSIHISFQKSLEMFNIFKTSEVLSKCKIKPSSAAPLSCVRPFTCPSTAPTCPVTTHTLQGHICPCSMLGLSSRGLK